MSNLAEVLELKYGAVANCNLETGSLMAWFHPTIPEPDAAQIAIDTAEYELQKAKATRIAVMQAAHDAAKCANISFTTAGAVTTDFQANATAIKAIKDSIAGFGDTGVVPVGFYFVAADNTHVTFTYADLKGLGRAIADRAWTAFDNLQTKKIAINAAADVAAVNAINW